MTLDEILATAISPALALLPARMDSVEARVMLLAIGLQESKFEHRYQVLNGTKRKGPARSFWQQEEGGGIKGIYNHAASRPHLEHICLLRSVPFGVRQIWEAIENDDVLAAGAARLLLFTDALPLPDVDDVDGAWKLYAVRCWRPGKPHPETWPGYHQQAREALGV
ncbi:hypothetical protein J7E62_09160 [Variovorax paradoxus]|nr:hypothetical protein [Variovorax paradoxus]